MKDRDIDKILGLAASTPHEVDPALLERISRSVGSSLNAVRPLPPAWVLASILFLICVATALAGAGHLGFYGIRKLSAPEIALIFPALCVFTWLAATVSVGEMVPGSRLRIAPPSLLAISSLALLAIFGALFHDYRVDRFVQQGIPCLRAGLLHAFVAGVASWLVLRRGFAVNSVAAGLATGTLASLAGVMMLELHCPNLKVLHVTVWHTAVIPLSGLAGALLGRVTHGIGRKSAATEN